VTLDPPLFALLAVVVIFFLRLNYNHHFALRRLT
jgi:hypothetical protein